MTSTSYRLPRHAVPSAYDIFLDASPKRSSFSGHVQIALRLRAATRSVELHAKDLSLTTVKAKAGRKSIVGKPKLHRDRETVELLFARELPKGRVLVDIDFKGRLNPSMHGLYLAKDGADRAIVSQCEAADARRIFPCFDEPDFKASLRWRVRTDSTYEVVTNGVPQKRERERVKRARQAAGAKARKTAKGAARVGAAVDLHTFKPTRVIPTYLAAVTIGELEATKAERVAGVPSRVFCPRGKLGQTGFAREVTARVLPWLASYFGQKYNYQKVDQVAVPGFDAGAMENVGAVFYRQNLLLMQPGATSWTAQKRIAEVITHELSHQWFGNLVTMKWWDDLWLNEAFATWIAFKAVDEWKPDWRIWDEYFDSKEAALEADALVSTHPVYSEVKSPAEATELFDVITYEKGCAVLRMVESYLGAERFRDGIRRYQAAFKNGNACGQDLWDKLGEASAQPVGELMQSWITQPGFPLVSVSASEIGGRTVLHVGQQRFFANGDEMQKPHEQVWTIPLVIRYDAGNGAATHRALLREREEAVTLPSDGKAAWVYPNDDATGFYRLRLSDELLEPLLASGLSSLTPSARMSLLDDQWALVRAGLATVEQFMDVLWAFRGERDYAVVRTMTGRLAYLDQRLVRDVDRPLLRDFVRELLWAELEELGWDKEPNEAEPRAAQRASIVSALGDTARTSDVLDEAERRAAQEMEDPTAVDPNLAGIVVALAALRGDEQRLMRHLDVYRARKEARVAPEWQSRYVAALPYFETPTVLRRVLDLCLDGTVPQEQLRTVLVPLISRRATQRDTWEFVKSHWKEIGPRVGLMGIARLVEATGALPVELAGDVAAFFTAHPVEEAKRALAKALEAMALRRELVQREAMRLSDWLSQRTAESL